MPIPTACPCCDGTKAHERGCMARRVPVAWPQADADDLRAEAERRYAALVEERRARYAAMEPDAAG